MLQELEFRVGDLLELKDGSSTSAKTGATARVTAIHYPYVTVVWVRNHLCGNQNDGRYFPSHFRLFKPKKVVELGREVSI